MRGVNKQGASPEIAMWEKVERWNGYAVLAPEAARDPGTRYYEVYVSSRAKQLDVTSFCTPA